MRNHILLSTFGAAAFFAASSGAAHSCPDIATKYTISTPNPNMARVEIETTLVSDYFVVANFVSSDGVATADFIENVKISGERETADITHAGNGAFPVAPFESGDRVKATYDLRLGHGDHPWDFGKEEVGVALNGGAYLVSRAAMLADYGEPACPIDVHFKTSDSAAPWAATGDNQYRATSLDAFHNNAFVFGDNVGRFSARTKHGRITFIHDDASKALARQAAKDTAKMVAHLTSIFGGFPTSNYHIFLLENDRPEGGAFRDSFALLHPSPAQEIDALLWRQGFIHEVIHLWLGHSVRPAQGADIEWFKEGFTDYLAIKTMWRLGFLDDQELAEKFENLIRRHTMGFFMSRGQVKLSQAGAQKAQNRLLIYGGGATLALLLDAHMAADQGPGAFEEMLRTLYANADEPYSQERLLASLNAATANYAGELLEKFDAGVTPVQIAELIEPYGIEMAFMIPDMIQLDLNPDGCSRNRCKPAFLRHWRSPR